jgi:hypothetical protein
MTKQHKATPEQWADQKRWAHDDADSSCILELRARIEALEAAQQPPLFTAEEVARIVAPITRDRALVERVADAIGAADDEGLTNMTWSNHSRAAILEVAAWLTENYASDVVGPPPHQMLRNEANQ